VLIENIQRVSAQLEFQAFGDLNRFFQGRCRSRTDTVEVAITGLPEILNAWTAAGVKVKAAGRFKRVQIQHGLAWVEMGWRLQERRRTPSDPGEQKLLSWDGTLQNEEEI
jgi:hypothetical protein